jgi:hypothetical protein
LFLFSTIRELWPLLRADYITSQISRLQECDVLFFCHDNSRGVSLGGRLYAPVADSVRECFEGAGLRCLTIARPWSRYIGDCAYGHPISINLKYFFDRLRRLLCKKLHLNFTLCQESLFEEIISKTKTRLIITIGAEADLSRAARKKRVFHIELLHGLGYPAIPWGWDQQPLDRLPQAIVSFDEVSTHSCRKLSALGIVVWQMPHPFLRRFLPAKQDRLPLEWRPINDESRGYSKTVLVTLTWGYAGDHGLYSHFEGILENGLFYNEIAELVSERKDIFWRFRFHPVQVRQEKYKHLLRFMDAFVEANSNSEWRESSSLPLPSVASACSGNITMMSMSCYEVAALGVPSLLLCPTLLNGGCNADYFDDLVTEGYARKTLVNKEILSLWISSSNRLPPRHSNLLDDNDWEIKIDSIMKAAGLSKNARKTL